MFKNSGTQLGWYIHLGESISVVLGLLLIYVGQVLFLIILIFRKKKFKLKISN